MTTIKFLSILSNLTFILLLHGKVCSPEFLTHAAAPIKMLVPVDQTPSRHDAGQAVHVLRIQSYLRTTGPICQAWVSQDMQIDHSHAVLTNSPYIARLLRVALETKSLVYVNAGRDNDIEQLGLPSPSAPAPPASPFHPGSDKDDFGSYEVHVRYVQAVSNGLGYTAFVHIGGTTQHSDVWIYTNDSIVGDILELAVKSDTLIQLQAAGDGRIKSVWLPAQ